MEQHEQQQNILYIIKRDACEGTHKKILEESPGTNRPLRALEDFRGTRHCGERKPVSLKLQAYILEFRVWGQTLYYLRSATCHYTDVFRHLAFSSASAAGVGCFG